MRRLAQRRSKRRRRIIAVGLVALLAGCSSIPNAVNPVEWYKGARDFVFGKEDQTRAPENGRSDPRAERGEAAPGAGQPIPDLNTVPRRPEARSREQRAQVHRGLVSDREDARRYSSEAVRRQGDPVNPLQTSPQTSPQAAARSAAPRIETPPRAARPSPRQAAPRPPKPPAASAPAPKPSPAPAPRQAAPRPPAPPAAPVQQAASAPAPRATPQRRPVPPVPDGGETETIVISSAGVQTESAATSLPALSPGISLPAPPPGAQAATSVGGVQSLWDFNPAVVRGSYQVATIMFRNGSSRLDSRDRRIIRQVFAQQRRTGGTIRIVGHASRRTSNMNLVRHKLVNLRVSAARADAVARELIKLGARPGSLFVGAVSSQYPRYHEYMPSGEAGNRRTEIFIDF